MSKKKKEDAFIKYISGITRSKTKTLEMMIKILKDIK